ncbi:MAG: hypothetical protein HKN80_14020 [Acidimicrobiia bacterium]|nr:hypothetical protein [Acidimicrobiia bacterium]
MSIQPLTPPTPPTAHPDEMLVLQADDTDVDVLANDVPGTAPLDPGSVTIIDDVRYGTTWVDSATGKVSYVRLPGNHASDSFTYVVTDTSASPLTSNETSVTITVDEGLLDPDGDGLTNEEEATHGTDPVLADTDGDGTEDGAEVQAGTDPRRPPGQVGLFNPASGEWSLRSADESTTAFYYGTPGDIPLLGDWNCDGFDTVGAFRPSDGFAYLRNTNDTGVADISFYFGIAGDIPVAGDWDGDGCDTLGVFRNGQVFLSNLLVTAFAEVDFWFGASGDQPFAGDFDNDGITEIGVFRPSTNVAYLGSDHTTGPASHEFVVADPANRLVTGDWDNDSTDTLGAWRASDATFFLSNTNDSVPADHTIALGPGSWTPVAGGFN